MIDKVSLNTIRIIKIILVIILLFFVISLMLGKGDSKAKLNTVSKKVISAMDTADMQEADSQMLKRLYGLNVNDYEGAILYSPVSNMDVHELLIVKLKSDEQSSDVEKAIRKRLDTQLKSFEGYGTDQTELLNNYVLDIQGNYIFYLVHPDAKKIEKIYRKQL